MIDQEKPNNQTEPISSWQSQPPGSSEIPGLPTLGPTVSAIVPPSSAAKVVVSRENRIPGWFYFVFLLVLLVFIAMTYLIWFSLKS